MGCAVDRHGLARDVAGFVGHQVSSQIGQFSGLADATQRDTADGGGVHTNSGVPNHGFALVVDRTGRTVTVTDPAEPDGIVAVICVALTTVKDAVESPNCTAVTSARFVPVITALDPPERVPEVGLIPDNWGAVMAAALTIPTPQVFSGDTESQIPSSIKG